MSFDSTMPFESTILFDMFDSTIPFGLPFESTETPESFWMSADELDFEAWFESCADLFAVAHNIAILICHWSHMFPNNPCRAERRPSAVIILSIFAILIPIIYNLLAGLNPWIAPLRDSSFLCSIWMRVTAGSLLLSKIVLYILFMERLFSVFSKSHFAFSRTFKRCTRISLILWAMAWTIFENTQSQSEFNEITGRCEQRASQYAYFIAATTCIVVEVAISILFSRRLLRLLTNRDRVTVVSIHEVDTTDAAYGILAKSSICTFIILLCTPTSLMLGYSWGKSGFWAALDSIVSTWMVMLMFHKHDRIYNATCKRCESLLSAHCLYWYSCHCCDDDGDDLKQISAGNMKISMGNTIRKHPVPNHTMTQTPPSPPTIEMMAFSLSTSTTQQLKGEAGIEMPGNASFPSPPPSPGDVRDVALPTLDEKCADESTRL